MDNRPEERARRVRRHLRAAASHQAAADRHEQAETFWIDRGDLERADLERRNARIERNAAELECDRARAEQQPRGD